MIVTGRKIENFQVPTCKLFRETVIDGQVCYEADLNQFKKNTNWEDSLQGGFGLIIDTNAEYDVKNLLREKEKKKKDKNKTFNILKPADKKFHVTLKTISKLDK